MAARDYATLGEVKARLEIDDAIDDVALEAAIEAASRMIDGHCGRFFYRTPSETRDYAASSSLRLTGGDGLDDLVSVAAVATDDDGSRAYASAWLATDWELEPANAAAHGQPYTRLYVAPESARRFPTARRAVRITGVFGWPSVPAPVREACVLQAIRLWKRPDAPFGVMGSPELGQLQALTRLDPDVVTLLRPYVRRGVY